VATQFGALLVGTWVTERIEKPLLDGPAVAIKATSDRCRTAI
jgi:hypothetical protein